MLAETTDPVPVAGEGAGDFFHPVPAFMAGIWNN
jgi:hypothetical protein